MVIWTARVGGHRIPEETTDITRIDARTLTAQQTEHMYTAKSRIVVVQRDIDFRNRGKLVHAIWRRSWVGVKKVEVHVWSVILSINERNRKS